MRTLRWAVVAVWLLAPVGVLAEDEPASRPKPAPSDAANELYVRIHRAFASANALDLEAGVVHSRLAEDGSRKEVASGTLRIHAAKPLFGEFRRELEEAGERTTVHLVADGSRLAYLNPDDKSYLDFGKSFSMFCDMTDLSPIYAWAGQKALEPNAIEMLPSDPMHAGERGLVVRSVEFRQELWVDVAGNLKRASVIHDEPAKGKPDRRQSAKGRMDYLFSKLELQREVKSEQYAVAVPKDFKPMKEEQETDPAAGLLAVGTPAPDVALIALDGTTFSLSSLKGKTVLLNFWFYHCFGCRQELPHLNAYYDKSLKQRDDVVVLCVNLRDPKDVINKYWASAKLGLRVVRQKGSEVSEAFGVVGYPTNYVVGPAGRVKYRAVGYDEAALDRALAADAPKKAP